jgi:Gpi18-like mannosyltransferase
VSNLAFGIALILLFRLARETYDDNTGRWSVVLLATFPFSFYFSAVYSESLFLLTVVGAFYFGKNQRWAPAAMSAACASAARATGVIVSLGIFLLYLSQIEWNIRRIRANILWLLISPLGLIGYMGFLWYRFDDPLLFLTSRNVPGWEQGMGLAAIWHSIKPALSVGAVISGN